jgi:hypothetical protein
MDFSKFKTSDWLKAGGGIAVLLFGFIAWSGDISEVAGIDVSAADCRIGGCPDGPNMFDHFFTGVIPWILLVAIGVLTFLAAAGIFRLPSSLPTPLIFLGASALATLLVVIRVIIGPKIGYLGVDAVWSRGIGMFIVLAGSIAVLVGSLQGFKESGGDLNDLKDMNKLKSSFGGGSNGGGTPPPPPPPGMMPPPPPPPAG